MSTWQPIDTAPKDGTEILLRKEASMHVVEMISHGWWESHVEEQGKERWTFPAYIEHGWGGFTPTHWAPIPGTIASTNKSAINNRMRQMRARIDLLTKLAEIDDDEIVGYELTDEK